jgi:hypothetical protein
MHLSQLGTSLKNSVAEEVGLLYSQQSFPLLHYCRIRDLSRVASRPEKNGSPMKQD